jgi:hypothetical protein
MASSRPAWATYIARSFFKKKGNIKEGELLKLRRYLQVSSLKLRPDK